MSVKVTWNQWKAVPFRSIKSGRAVMFTWFVPAAQTAGQYGTLCSHHTASKTGNRFCFPSHPQSLVHSNLRFISSQTGPQSLGSTHTLMPLHPVTAIHANFLFYRCQQKQSLSKEILAKIYQRGMWLSQHSKAF